MFQENTDASELDAEPVDPLSLTVNLPKSDPGILFIDTASKADEKKPETETVDRDTESPAAKKTARSKISDDKGRIRIGSDFQAVCPPLVPIAERDLDALNEKALTVWLPSNNIPEPTLQAYITLCHEKFGYNIEQALAMLFWHKFDIQSAIKDLDNYAPFPDEWTREDKIIFEEALLVHGKNFLRIRELLPDKTVGGLIYYYYTWKKRRGRQRALERRGRPRIEKS